MLEVTLIVPIATDGWVGQFPKFTEQEIKINLLCCRLISQRLISIQMPSFLTFWQSQIIRLLEIVSNFLIGFVDVTVNAIVFMIKWLYLY